MADRPARRSLALACVALALGAGCSMKERVGALASLDVRSRPDGPERGTATARDRYVAARGKKKTAPGFTFAQLTPDVWAPFDVSIHTGLFDPAQTATANGTRVCLEIDNVGFTIFYDVCATWAASPAGWTVAAFTGAPIVNLPGSFFTEAEELELRTETDGTTLRFYARPWTSTKWQSVAETPWPGQTGPLEAAAGVAPILKGTLVGFDDPSFVSGPPPIAATGVGAVAAAGNEALLEGLAAFLALDGASPDFGVATAQLASAAEELAEAQTLLAALPPDGTTKKAGRGFAKGAKKLERAQADVAEQDADGALKNLAKAAAAVEKAVLRLVPQPFPAP